MLCVFVTGRAVVIDFECQKAKLVKESIRLLEISTSVEIQTKVVGKKNGKTQ